MRMRVKYRHTITTVLFVALVVAIVLLLENEYNRKDPIVLVENWPDTNKDTLEYIFDHVRLSTIPTSLRFDTGQAWDTNWVDIRINKQIQSIDFVVDSFIEHGLQFDLVQLDAADAVLFYSLLKLNPKVLQTKYNRHYPLNCTLFNVRWKKNTDRLFGASLGTLIAMSTEQYVLVQVLEDAFFVRKDMIGGIIVHQPETWRNRTGMHIHQKSRQTDVQRYLCDYTQWDKTDNFTSCQGESMFAQLRRIGVELV